MLVALLPAGMFPVVMQLAQAFPNRGSTSSAAWSWGVPRGSWPAIAY
jgi:hypothetical protein